MIARKCALFLAAVASAATIARAQDAGTATKPQDSGGKGPPQMSAAEQAMMEKYMKAGTPGPEHQKLMKLAGKWKLQVTSWMGPGAPPMKSDGTAEFTSLFGGRYLQQEVKGSMGDQPFEGHGMEGFDNVTQEYFGTWIDSMSTGLTVLRGKCAAGTRKCTYKGTMPDAVAGKAVPASETITYTDDEIVYTRQ
jgi:hypothetical protein